jgi:hypothetical protein
MLFKDLPFLRASLLIIGATFAAVTGAHAAEPGGAAAEAPFLADNDRAMTKMMDGMSIKPSGNIDQDFAAMMIPHHQGAIDMAQAELRYGHNEQLRRIAQEIIVEQQQEIIAMHLALGQPLPPPAPAPDQQRTLPQSKSDPVSNPTMHMSMPTNTMQEPK